MTMPNSATIARLICIFWMLNGAAMGWASNKDSLSKGPNLLEIQYDYNVICTGNQAQLSAKVDPSLSTAPVFLWSTGETNAQIAVNPNTTTSYSLEVFDNLGNLLAQAIQTIYVAVKPNTQAIHDTLCQDEEATVGMLTNLNKAYFWWNTNGSTDTINTHPKFTTTYTVKVSEYPLDNVSGYRNACYTDDSAIAVVLTEALFDVTPDTSVCRGFDVRLYTRNASQIIWSTLQTTPEITVTVDQEVNHFFVEANDRFGCRSKKHITVTVSDGPVGSIIVQDDTVCIGAQSLLVATGGNSYLWNTFDKNDSIIISPRGKTVYSVKVFAGPNQTLCQSIFHVTIEAVNCDKIFFPSAISLSGMNRVFKPIGIPLPYCTYYLGIFNRWGQMLFETNDFHLGWDGSFRGEKVSPGVYVYIFKSINKRDVWEKTGTITVIN